jgi:hypothetical protein
LRQPSWRLVQSTGSFETKIEASNMITLLSFASCRANGPVAMNLGANRGRS